MPARLDAATTAVAAGTLADARGENAVLRVSVRVRDVTDSTDAAVRGVLADTVGGAGVAADVRRSLTTAPIVLADGTRTVLVGADALDPGSALAEGAWPARAGEAVVAAELAAASGIRVGDRVQARGAAFVIVGTTVAGATAPPWLRVPPPDGGEDPVGAVVVADAELARLAPDAWSRWSVVPDAARAAPRALAALPSAWRRTGPALVAAGVDDAELSGALVPTARAAVARADALAATAPVSLGVAGAVGIVAALAFAQLLVAAREDRRALLWARGAGTRRLTADAAGELVVPAVAGTAAGAAVAAAVLVLTHTPPSASLAAAALAPLVLIAVTALVAVLDARRREHRVDRPGWRRVAVVAVLAVVVVLAGISSAQLLQYGSLGADGGRAGVDAVVAAAPALALVATAATGVALLAATGRPLDRAAAAAHRPVPLLVARGIFARGALSLVPLLLAAVAVAHGVFAAGYAATWDRVAAADAAAHGGADLRVSDGTGIPDATLPAILGVPGVTAAAPARTRAVSVASGSATVLQIAAPAVERLAAVDGAERTRLAAGIAPAEPPGAPADGRVRVTATGEGAARLVTARVWFLDEYGCLASVDAAMVDGSAAATAPAGCGPGAAPRVVAVDLDAGAPLTDEAAVFTARVAVGADDVPLATWSVVDPDAFGTTAGTSDTMAIVVGTQRVRIVAPVASPLPAVASGGFATASGTRPGDLVSVALGDARDTPLVISAIVDSVPGADADAAALVDGRALTVLSLASGQGPPRPSSLWVGADDAAGVAATLPALLPRTAIVDGAGVGSARALLAGAPAIVAQGAVASVVLAIIGVAGVVVARRRRLADERAALRAAGAPARAVRAAAAAEVFVLLAAGAAVGLAAGVVVVLVLAPALASGAATSVLSVPAAVDPAATVLIALAAVVLAAAAALAAARGARERRAT